MDNIKTMNPKYYPKRLAEFSWKLLNMTIFHFNWGKKIICPYCNIVINDINHVLIDCNFASKTWEEYEKLSGLSLNMKEKLFGPKKKEKTKWIKRIQIASILRNLWINFWKRINQERYSSHIQLINRSIREDIVEKKHYI